MLDHNITAPNCITEHHSIMSSTFLFSNHYHTSACVEVVCASGQILSNIHFKIISWNTFCMIPYTLCFTVYKAHHDHPIGRCLHCFHPELWKKRAHKRFVYIKSHSPLSLLCRVRYNTWHYMMTSSNGNIFPRNWPFVRGIYRPVVNYPYKG